MKAPTLVFLIHLFAAIATGDDNFEAVLRHHNGLPPIHVTGSWSWTTSMGESIDGIDFPSRFDLVIVTDATPPVIKGQFNPLSYAHDDRVGEKVCDVFSKGDFSAHVIHSIRTPQDQTPRRYRRVCSFDATQSERAVPFAATPFDYLLTTSRILQNRANTIEALLGRSKALHRIRVDEDATLLRVVLADSVLPTWTERYTFTLEKARGYALKKLEFVNSDRPDASRQIIDVDEFLTIQGLNTALPKRATYMMIRNEHVGFKQIMNLETAELIKLPADFGTFQVPAGYRDEKSGELFIVPNR